MQPSAPTSLAEAVRARKIPGVYHFTTNRGLAGVLASRNLLSRADLPLQEYLEHVYKPNCVVRKDAAYLGYVNTSVSQINAKFFEICSERWHAGSDVWWVLLEFTSDVLMMPGVIFTTTNNMYRGAQRASGVEGFEAMFANEVSPFGAASASIRRPLGHPCFLATDPQAEALVPDRVPTTDLTAVYVRDHHCGDKVEAMINAVSHAPVNIVCEPTRFNA